MKISLTGIPEEEFTDGMRELYHLMSDLSENAFFAGWIHGNEYGLWHAMQNHKAGKPARYGDSVISDSDIKTLCLLAEWLNGWLIWLDDYYDPKLPVEQWGVRFVEMDIWLKKYERESRGD